MKKRIHFRQRLRNGAACPFCEEGHVAEQMGIQRCDQCGRITWNSFFILPFSAVLDGDHFVMVGDEEGKVWVKGRQMVPRTTAVLRGGKLAASEDFIPDPLNPWANCYQLHHPEKLGGCGPEANVIRIIDLYQGDRYSFN